ncbi:DNA cytosine methyltransferase [Nostoc sp.]|uniref:DNA cytosine methyltransferase n=1 Tax=Nostoc sp. TaxID=1180 RepID=UPI002FF12003
MKILDICSGIGGFTLGHKISGGFETVAFCEINQYCQQVLSLRFPQIPIIPDIHDITVESISRIGVGAIAGIIGGFPCFAKGTLVLTKDGYRPIESISIGDKVLTHRGRWRTVAAVMSKENAALRIIKAGGVPGVVTTDEHPFYGREQGRLWNNSNRQYQRTFKEPRWVEASTLTKNYRLGQILPSPEQSDKSTNFWWIVGRYLADGWRVDRLTTGNGNPCERGNTGKVIICSGKHKYFEVAERIRRVFHATESEERTTIKFHITNKEFYKYLEQFGRKAEGKTLPGFIFSLDGDSARALLDGWLSGDGYKSKLRSGSHESRGCSVSKSLALGMALLAQRAYGVIAGIRECKVPATKIIEGRLVNQHNFWIVSIPQRNRSAFVEGDYGWKQVRSNQPFGVGTVYNIAVDEDESYIADGAIVHNCQPFSAAGQQFGSQDERNLWPEVARVIRDLRPSWVCLENVPNLLTIESGDYFRKILWEFSQMGFDVEWGVLSAASVGAVHRRERIWIIATTSNTQSPRWESPWRNISQKRTDPTSINSCDDADTNSERLEGRECQSSRQGSLSQFERCRGDASDSCEKKFQQRLGEGIQGGKKSLQRYWMQHTAIAQPASSGSDDGIPTGMDGCLLTHTELADWLTAATIPSFSRFSAEEVRSLTREDQAEYKRLWREYQSIRRQHKEQIAALGNAIVPQCAAKIFDRLKIILG